MTITKAEDLTNLASQISDLAKQAGAEILHFYRTGVVVAEKRMPRL